MTDPRDLPHELIHRGRKFDLRLVQAPTRAGSRPRELVVHPGAVVILPLLEGDRVVMIENERYAVGRPLLELPAGTLEPGEPPAVCAARELIEETGYRAGRIEPLWRFWPAPGFCTELMHAFLATELTHVGQDLEEDEAIEVRIEPLATVRRMVVEGRIEDGKTLATLATWLLRGT